MLESRFDSNFAHIMVQRTSFHYQGLRENQREEHGGSLNWKEAYDIQLGYKDWSKTSLFKRERDSVAKIAQAVSQETL
jgi:hypothetical protein